MKRFPEGPLKRLSQILLVLVWLELGLLLILVPWSEYWEMNYFLYQYPQLALIAGNSFLRGAVSGLGVLNILFALESIRRRTPPVANRT
ncbi:MAG TPA: hypothetical protein VMU43_09875 [Candidatus Acidoferrum sp.]|nr:hypothetical protein [Candidatus Acidoferrum sp.]